MGFFSFSEKIFSVKQHCKIDVPFIPNFGKRGALTLDNFYTVLKILIFGNCVAIPGWKEIAVQCNGIERECNVLWNVEETVNVV